MTSRLDRLVTLLDTGSTSVIRNTAAQQLADVQKSHPDELFNLIARILPYLRSKSWETRTAASKAIGGIVGNADQFDPNAEDGGLIMDAIKAEEDTVMTGTGDETALKSGSMQPPDMLSLETLDISAILSNGQKLLGSAGTDVESSYA
ncbi:hypothetical protein KEM56_003600, partial [Ascosphaera pollenicola]